MQRRRGGTNLLPPLADLRATVDRVRRSISCQECVRSIMAAAAGALWQSAMSRS
jgi:hypothetical protein